MKTCCQCGVEDRPIPEAARSGEGMEINHYVAPELMFLKTAEYLSPRLKRQGWRERDPMQGRRVLERDVCRDCMNSNYIREELNQEQRSKALKLEQNDTGEENFYLMLADVDGSY